MPLLWGPQGSSVGPRVPRFLAWRDSSRGVFDALAVVDDVARGTVGPDKHRPLRPAMSVSARNAEAVGLRPDRGLR